MDPHRWSFALMSVGEIGYIAFAPAEGEMNELNSEEKQFLRPLLGERSCEMVENLYQVERPEIVAARLLHAGFRRGGPAQDMLEWFISEGYFIPHGD